MQQTLSQLTGNYEQYNPLLNNARKIIYKHYPKTPLLKDDDYNPSPNFRTPEQKSNSFKSLVGVVLKIFKPKPLLLKADPYESGIDFVYNEKQIEEAQDQGRSDDVLIKVHGNTIPEMYDLYLDAYKRMKKDGYEIIPPFVVSHITYNDAAFIYNDATIMATHNLASFNRSIKSTIEDALNKQLKYIPNELKEKIKNLSPQDKAKFMNFFNKCAMIHEMQHYKQFVTMLKVYGVEETKKIMIESLEKAKIKIADKQYKEVTGKEPVSGMTFDEKLKENTQKYPTKMLEELKIFKYAVFRDGEDAKKEEYNNLVDIIIAKYEEIKDSKNLESLQNGIDDILTQFEALEKFKENIDKNYHQLFAFLIVTFKSYFQETKDKNITFQQYLCKKTKEAPDINEEQYQKVYNSVKDQPITEAERNKAKEYEEAHLNYMPMYIDLDTYFSNPLEVEAYTVQAQAALEKLEEYNERHKGDKQQQ